LEVEGLGGKGLESIEIAALETERDDWWCNTLSFGGRWVTSGYVLLIIVFEGASAAFIWVSNDGRPALLDLLGR